MKLKPVPQKFYGKRQETASQRRRRKRTEQRNRARRAQQHA